jgi:hypothetical protein
MNTLVSWIDVDAVSGMARDMAAPDPAETGNTGANPAASWAGDGPAPVSRLVADDFRLPENFAAAPFPAPGPTVPPEERSRVRNFLEEIKQKAEHSGLIPRPAEVTPPAPSTSSGQGAGGVAEMAAGSGAGQTAAALPTLAPLPSPAPLSPLGQASSNSPPVAHPVPEAFKPLRAMPFSVPPGGGYGSTNAGTSAAPQLAPLGSSAPPPVSAAADIAAAPGGAADQASGLPPMRRHVPHFEVPLGPLSTRVRALTDWIRRQIDTTDIFILNTQGCPVGDREAVPEIVASAVVLAEAARHAAGFLPEAPVGALYLDLEDERRLCVITTSTTHGHFLLGLVLPDTLVPRAADRLRRALKRTVEADAPAPLRLPPRERW